MNLYLIIGIIIVSLIVVYVLMTYNSFVKLKNQLNEAFSTMDVYLKKRWDLIPNIVEVVKSYSKHEEETFQKIIELRNGSYEKMNAGEKVEANNQMNHQLGKLMAIAEAYPELRSNENYKDLQRQLTKVEEDIANARKYYNANVREYNNKVQMFPSNLVAVIFGQKEQKMYEANEKEREIVKISM